MSIRREGEIDRKKAVKGDMEVEGAYCE